MGAEASACLTPRSELYEPGFDYCQSIQKGRRSLPLMVLHIEAFVMGTNEDFLSQHPADDRWPGSPVVSALLGGKPVAEAQHLSIPTGAIPVLLQADAAPTAHLELNFQLERGDGQQHEDFATLGIGVARLAYFGAPLYTSLWLGLDPKTTQNEQGKENVLQCMMRSRRPLLPKVKVTFFRPYVPEAGIQWQPSSGINVLAPDVQATLDDTDLGADEEEDCAVKVAQVNGLIRCLRESNSVVTGLQRECRDHFGRRLRDLKERIDEQRELLGVVSQLALLRGEISIAYIMRLAALQAWRRVSMVGSCADRLTMRVHDTERFASLLRVAGERWFEESAFQSLQACLQAWRSWKQRAAAVAGRSAAAGDCVSRRMDGEGWALQRWVMASWRSYLRHPRSVADYAWGARSDASAEVRLYLRCWSMVTRSSRTVRKVADHARLYLRLGGAE
eukprot:TRINITY_DN9249_c0_g1_i5.p1 TRINITY_DN9249_c0_g1~~TRINITY_DN9249_c0_g1_i5.p1  ORF type:complete len:447 (+),score=65.96 TRINITY_DN9249_c0_g1_i5:116-1456(+)